MKIHSVWIVFFFVCLQLELEVINERVRRTRSKVRTEIGREEEEKTAQRHSANGWTQSTLRFLFKFHSFDFKNWNYVTRFGFFLIFFFAEHSVRLVSSFIFLVANRIQKIFIHFGSLPHSLHHLILSAWVCPCTGFRSFHKYPVDRPRTHTSAVRLILPKWVCLLASLVLRSSQQTIIKCCASAENVRMRRQDDLPSEMRNK